MPGRALFGRSWTADVTRFFQFPTPALNRLDGFVYSRARPQYNDDRVRPYKRSRSRSCGAASSGEPGESLESGDYGSLLLSKDLRAIFAGHVFALSVVPA